MLLTKMLDTYDCDVVFVSDRFQCTDVTVVGSVHVGVAALSYALQGVNDYEVGCRVIGEEHFDLIDHAVRQRVCSDCEVKVRRCVLCDLTETLLDTVLAVLETEIENVTL